jgi:hypothetical protein
MAQDILQEIIKNAENVRSNPTDLTGRAQNLLVENLREIAASDYSTREKKAIIVKAYEIASCPAILPKLIKQATDAKTKEIFAEIGVDYANEKKSSVHIIPLVKDTGLEINSPARKAIVQAAIDFLPLAKSNQHYIADMVRGICKTPQEVMAAAQKIGEIVQAMNPDDACLPLMKASYKAAAELPEVRAAHAERHGDKLPKGGRPMGAMGFLKAEIG